MPQIEVSFNIDANGIVNVSAKDKASGKEQKITITSSSGLSEEEIKKMVQDAVEHEAQDKKERETVEKRNKLDALIIEIEKTVREHKDKLPEADVKTVEAALEKAKTALKEHVNNGDELQKASDELLQASHKVAEYLYKQGQEGGGSSGTPGSSDTNNDGNGQGPIDAEINQ